MRGEGHKQFPFKELTRVAGYLNSDYNRSLCQNASNRWKQIIQRLPSIPAGQKRTAGSSRSQASDRKTGEHCQPAPHGGTTHLVYIRQVAHVRRDALDQLRIRLDINMQHIPVSASKIVPARGVSNRGRRQLNPCSPSTEEPTRVHVQAYHSRFHGYGRGRMKKPHSET